MTQDPRFNTDIFTTNQLVPTADTMGGSNYMKGSIKGGTKHQVYSHKK